MGHWSCRQSSPRSQRGDHRFEPGMAYGHRGGIPVRNVRGNGLHRAPTRGSGTKRAAGTRRPADRRRWTSRARDAGVAQWQSGSLPNCTQEFDSPRPLGAEEAGGGRRLPVAARCAARPAGRPGTPPGSGRKVAAPDPRHHFGSSANGRPRCFGHRDAGSTPALPATRRGGNAAVGDTATAGRRRTRRCADLETMPCWPNRERRAAQHGEGGGSSPSQGTMPP
jgi:hypothetical protein